MSTCNVAVIDSKIDESCNYNIKEKISYINDFVVQNKHATNCLSIIESIAPNTTFTIVEVLNENLKCSSQTLINALEDMLIRDVNVINLSLSTQENFYFSEIENICNKLYKQGKIIISSKSNRGFSSFPAESKYVLGVTGSCFENNEDFWYKPNATIQCVGNVVPTIIKLPNSKLTIWGGNSKATACISGIISKNWELFKSCNFENYDNILYSLAQKEEWNIEDINRDIYSIHPIDAQVNPEHQKDVYILLKKIIKKVFGLDIEYFNNTHLLSKGTNLLTAENLICELYEVFNIGLNNNCLRFSDFSNVNTLCAQICNIIINRS